MYIMYAYRALESADWVDKDDLIVIVNTTVPVIKFKTKPNEKYQLLSVSLDVSFEVSIAS